MKEILFNFYLIEKFCINSKLMYKAIEKIYHHFNYTLSSINNKCSLLDLF